MQCVKQDNQDHQHDDRVTSAGFHVKGEAAGMSCGSVLGDVEAPVILSYCLKADSAGYDLRRLLLWRFSFVYVL